MARVFTLRAPTALQVSHFLARQRLSPLTYPEAAVGATLAAAALPPGYHHERVSIVLGDGDAVFARAAAGIRAWCAPAGAGIEIEPADAPITVGTTVALVIRMGPAHVLAACRIVAVVDEPDRYGFAYGTLPSHPEEGEESFVVARDTSGAVRFDIVAFSRPHDWVTKLGSPVARRVQTRTSRRYLEGMRDYVAAG
jgi:uncharacterized protein (UPF0548 family)